MKITQANITRVWRKDPKNPSKLIPYQWKGRPSVTFNGVENKFQTIKALREQFGNVPRSHIKGKTGNYVYEPE